MQVTAGVNCLPTHALPRFSPGQVIAIGDQNYRLASRPLGSGAYGTVIAARHMELDVPVSIKVMHAPAASGTEDIKRASMRAELRAFEALRDVCETAPGVPCLLQHMWYGNDTLVIVYSYMPGIDGDLMFLNKRAESAEKVLTLLLRTAQTLVAVHSAGVTHTDIKPDNLIVSNDQVGLIDYGLACTQAGLRHDLSTCHTQVASKALPAHMDPMFVDGVSNRYQADIFSLAEVFRFWIQQAGPSILGDRREAVGALVSRMQRLEPRARPPATVVAAILDSLLWGADTVVPFHRDQLRIERRLSPSTFLVTDAERERVLKVQAPSSAFDRSPAREVAVLRELRDKGLCSKGFASCLVDEVVTDTQVLMLLELVPNAANILQRLPNSSHGRIALALEAARSLNALHEADVAHLDLRPSKLLVNGDGHVVLVGFGAACSERLSRVDPGLCRTRRRGAGTGAPRPAHVAPDLWRESLRVQNVYAADIYSLGVIFQGMGEANLRALGRRMASESPRDRPRLGTCISLLENAEVKTRPLR